MSYAPRSTTAMLTMYSPQAEYLVELIGGIETKGAFAAHKIRLIAALAPQIDSFNKARQGLVDKFADQEQVDKDDASKGTKPRVYIVEEGKQVLKFTSPEQQEGVNTAIKELADEVGVAIDLKSNPTIYAALGATLKLIESDACPSIENKSQIVFYEVLSELTAALAK